ncbi:MAG: SufS family cysteine desulfurase [Treponema sp.]|nr:SufS family cysteine desulfurase [Treponema sp.]
MKDYKKDFPIFADKKNEGLIYFDNAATSQRPQKVIDALSDFYKSDNANPLRGLYDLSVRATDAYQNSRKTIARFVGAENPNEIIFTRNASESLNLVAYSYALKNLKAGDQIAVSVMEHHSNILPWQMAAQKTGAVLVWLECDKESGIIPQSEYNKICEKTKIVAITQVSNVLGTTNPIKEIAAIAHKNGAVIVVDGAQALPHISVNVQDLDADFYAFSGHKFCGPTGIGGLYAKMDLLESMDPFLRGGEMIEYVTREGATWAEVPAKFEAGTVNVGGAVGMAAAAEYLEEIGMENIARHDNELASLMVQEMKKIPHVNIVGNKDGSKRCGIVTFTIDGVHPHDIASILDTEKIAIRAGHHCAQPLGQYLGLPATARASLYFYNTEEEVKVFCQKLSKVREWAGFKD